MKCPKCGKELTNDSNFCEFCGTQVRKIRKPKSAPWIVMTIIFCVLFLGIGGFFYYDHTSNRRALEAAEEEAAWLFQAERNARNDAAKQREEARKAKENANDYKDYYYYAIELESQIENLKKENNNLNSRINDKDREISNLKSRVPQSYKTIYKNQTLYYRTCNGDFSTFGCEYSGYADVTVYTKANGYGLTDWGWIPMNRLNKY